MLILTSCAGIGFALSGDLWDRVVTPRSDRIILGRFARIVGEAELAGAGSGLREIIDSGSLHSVGVRPRDQVSTSEGSRARLVLASGRGETAHLELDPETTVVVDVESAPEAAARVSALGTARELVRLLTGGIPGRHLVHLERGRARLEWSGPRPVVFVASGKRFALKASAPSSVMLWRDGPSLTVEGVSAGTVELEDLDSRRDSRKPRTHEVSAGTLARITSWGGVEISNLRVKPLTPEYGDRIPIASGAKTAAVRFAWGSGPGIPIQIELQGAIVRVLPVDSARESHRIVNLKAGNYRWRISAPGMVSEWISFRVSE